MSARAASCATPGSVAHARAGVCDFLTGAGWTVTGETASPIAGGDGNAEFLIAARKPPKQATSTAEIAVEELLQTWPHTKVPFG